ncbi:hypothetical protein LVD17_04160 [Fulvivirga ulvae]|uniref:hypothetical protein n=1 Tax=Fulvivirga ulvae TaxID=2904245 RepID=UPI001F33699C|nr:hypothetical protein [Fulvivirga ulvae]UII33021.1 hypothetical protein LVD17_04160 [Fulvivirga ulvae]
MQKLIYILLFSFLVIGCSSDDDEDTQVTACTDMASPKGNRLIGMDLLDETPSSDFSNNLALAQKAGIDFIAVHLQWTALEPQPMTYEDPSDALALFNDFIEANDLMLSLTIRPIDLTGKTVPEDLETTRFNDPDLIARFKALIDFVFTRIDYKRLTSLQLGNEIDGYDASNEHPDFWSDYGAFLSELNNHADVNYPGLKIGFTATHEGLTHGSLSDAGVFTALAAVVDVLGVTYYPINTAFEVEAPEVPATDLATLVSIYKNTPIYLQEVGYPSASANSSSEQVQAQFVCRFFKAWDTYAAEIPLVNWVRLHDASPDGAKQLAGPYGLTEDKFIEFLRTLGLRTYDGQDKAAFVVLQEQTRRRGW